MRVGLFGAFFLIGLLGLAFVGLLGLIALVGLRKEAFVGLPGPLAFVGLRADAFVGLFAALLPALPISTLSRASRSDSLVVIALAASACSRALL